MLCQKVPWRGVSPQASAEKSDSLRGSERGEIKLSVVLCSLMKKILEVLIRLPRNYVDYAERWASCARSRSSCAAPVLRWLGRRIARGLLPYTRLRMISGIEERNTLPPSATSQPQATASPRPLFRCPFPFGKKKEPRANKVRLTGCGWRHVLRLSTRVVWLRRPELCYECAATPCCRPIGCIPPSW